MDAKVIHDSVHGSVEVGGVFLRMLGRPEIQRLMGVHQLGLGHLVFPGANHTRFEHCLGAYELAGRMSRALLLSDDDSDAVRAAALLHDLGHAPFSHTLEEVLGESIGIDHMEATVGLIRGELEPMDERDARVIGEMPPIADELERSGIDPDLVCDLIVSPGGTNGATLMDFEAGQGHFENHNCLNQIIHGPVDIDQMDYLLRDAHYTGVAHGTIDIERIMNTVVIHHGDVMVRRGGVVAVEGLMVARALMYTSVYFHKTARIAEMMLAKAVEMAGRDALDGIHRMRDSDLESRLLDHGGEPSRLVTLLRNRRLYKRAYAAYTMDMEEGSLSALVELTDPSRRRGMEAVIADHAGISGADVLLDLPGRSELLHNHRRGKTDVPILDGGRVRSITRYSPISKALQTRPTHDWAVMVSCPSEHVGRVSKAARRELNP